MKKQRHIFGTLKLKLTLKVKFILMRPKL